MLRNQVQTLHQKFTSSTKHRHQLADGGLIAFNRRITDSLNKVSQNIKGCGLEQHDPMPCKHLPSIVNLYIWLLCCRILETGSHFTSRQVVFFGI